MKLSFDEMQTLASGGAIPGIRKHYREYQAWLNEQPTEVMHARRDEAEMIFRRVGITFAVYGAKDEDGAGTERLIPFDLIPRVIPADEWSWMQRGLRQRVTALNRFLHDVYHDQAILKAGIVPADQVLNNAQFRPQMMGVDVAGDIYSHIAGIDIVRAAQPDGSGTYYVLEDNLRVPSGVSYMLENRKMMMRLFPELFARHRVEPVAHYPDMLLETLRAVAPAAVNEPQVVVLTPGMYNSAYFEHAFLAQQMGVELVEGQDLFVKDGFVYMRTTQGPRRVDVIYRRLDDDFLDPTAFRSDTTLGCAGLLDVYRKGNITLCQCHRHRGGGRQVHLSLRAEDDRVLPGRKADPGERAHLPVPRGRRPEIRAGPPGRTGGEGSARRRRLRHAGGPGGHEGRDRGVPRRSCWPSPATTSPSPRWRCPPAPPMWKAASRRATSTCGPSCCRAPTTCRACRWCPAA